MNGQENLIKLNNKDSTILGRIFYRIYKILNNLKGERTNMKNSRWLSLIAGVLLIISSIFVFRHPIANLVTLAFLLSFTMLVSGIAEIAAFFTLPKEDKKRAWTLVSGILTVIISLWLLSSSFIEMSMMMPTIFAFWIMMSGITRMVAGIQLKETGFTVLGIIGIIVGFILLYHPLFSGLMMSGMIAGVFMYQGIVSITSFFTSKK